MTYKEFEQKLKELDEGLVFYPREVYIEVRYMDRVILTIDSNYPYKIDTDGAVFDNIVEHKPYAGELFDLCVELAKTPIDERVEQQRYYVVFGNGYMLCRNWKNSLSDISIQYPDEDSLEEFGKIYYTFTEAEIKQIDERYWTFAVPVEEEN